MHQEALINFNKSLEIKKSVFGREHTDYAKCLENIGL